MPKAGRVKASGRPQPVLSFLRTCFISNKDLAKAVGYSETYTSMANRGLQPTSADYREKVAAYLELSPEVLFDVEPKDAATAAHLNGESRPKREASDPWTTAERDSPLPPPPWTIEDIREWINRSGRTSITVLEWLDLAEGKGASR